MPRRRLYVLGIVLLASIAFTILLSFRFLYQVHAVGERDSLGTSVEVASRSVDKRGVLGTTSLDDAAPPSLPTNATTSPFVITYSLWGSGLKYVVGMINVCLTHAQLYPPAWKIWIYHDNTVPSEIINELEHMGHVKLINVETDLPAWVKDNLNPMSWRFLIASDQTVPAYAVRDSDSLPSKRERAAIEEFLESGKAFHIIRDHPMHNPTHFAPILGGMWGGLHRAVPHMDKLLRQQYPAPWRGKGRAYANDQDFLWQEIMPIVYNDCLQHDSYYCRESNAIAFPLSRKEANETYQYVGNSAALAMEIKVDSRLIKIDNKRKYETCLEDRRLLEEKMKAEGIASFATAVNTTFTGKIRGLSTEAWGKWRKTFIQASYVSTRNIPNTFKSGKAAKPKIKITKSTLEFKMKNKTFFRIN